MCCAALNQSKANSGPLAGSTLSIRPDEALPLGTTENSHDGEFALDLLDQLSRKLKLPVLRGLLQRVAMLGQQRGAHVAATALEAVRRLAQLLGLSTVAGALQQAQPLLRVAKEGVQ